MNSYKKKLLMSFSILIMLTIIYSCTNFYMVTKSKAVTDTEKASQIENLKNENRYFILRSGGAGFWMKHIIIDSSKMLAQCVLDSVSNLHQFYINRGNSRTSYKPRDKYEEGIVTEVHFYIDDDTSANYGNYTLHLDKIKKIEIIQKNKKKTTMSYVLGGLGIAAGAYVVLSVIAVFAFIDSLGNL